MNGALTYSATLPARLRWLLRGVRSATVARVVSAPTQEGQIDVVDDLDEHVVGHRGRSTRDVLVAEEDDRHGGYARVQRSGGHFAARDGARHHRQPHRGAGVVRALVDQGEQLGVMRDAGE